MHICVLNNPKKVGAFMKGEYSVSLKKIINEIGLKEYYMPSDPENLLVYSKSIDRPGLQLIGHLEYFDDTQIVVLGMTEYSYLKCLSPEERLKHLEPILSPSASRCRRTRDGWIWKPRSSGACGIWRTTTSSSA